MLLSDHEIDAAIMTGEGPYRIGLHPYNTRRLQPTSVDLTLDAQIRIPTRAFPGTTRIDMREVKPGYTDLVEMDKDGWDMPFGSFILASTVERLKLPDNLAARVEGKSSIGRVGLAIHLTAGFIDPGFDGQVTLEMYNFTPWPIRLYPGMPIAQLCFMRCTPPARDYSKTGHYQGQTGPTESRYKIE